MAPRRLTPAGLLVAAAIVVPQSGARPPISALRVQPTGHTSPPAGAQAGTTSADWFDRLQRWFAAVGRHVPGTHDGAVDALAVWTADDLDAVMRDMAALASEVARHPVPPGSPVERLAIQSRGRVLPPDMIQPLVRGTGPSGGLNGFLVRAALLHTDVAVLGPAGPPSSSRQGALQALDGQSVGFRRQTTHLYHARALLDLVQPEPSKDATVRLWYLAVASWLRDERRLGDLESHLNRAVKLFPRDAEFWLLTACFHEALASPPVQGVIESAPIPRNSISVRSASDEMRLALDAFKRSLGADPGLEEARIRRARALASQGRHRDAVLELQAALVSPASPRLLYYGFLFLGAEEEALGHGDAARAAYERARTLFPRAQSPYLALSQLARSSGNTAAALASVQQLLELQGTGDDRLDPWWAYYANCGPDAVALLTELRTPFLTPGGN